MLMAFKMTGMQSAKLSIVKHWLTQKKDCGKYIRVQAFYVISNMT